MRPFFALVALSMSAAAAAVTPTELLGAWQMTTAQVGEKPLAPEITQKMLMVIGPDSFSVGDQVGHIDAVPRRKGRAWLMRTQGPQAGTRLPVLYGFQHGELVMATGEDGGWPASLTPTGKAGNIVARFRKQF